MGVKSGWRTLKQCGAGGEETGPEGFTLGEEANDRRNLSHLGLVGL